MRQHLYHTREGDFLIPEQWKECLTKDVLSLTISLRSRVLSLGIEPHSFLQLCKQLDEFNSWYSIRDQRMFGVRKMASKESRKKARATQSDPTNKQRITETNRQSRLRYHIQLEVDKSLQSIINDRKPPKYSPRRFNLSEESILKRKKTFAERYGTPVTLALTEHQILQVLNEQGLIPLERVTTTRRNIPFSCKCAVCGYIFVSHFATGWHNSKPFAKSCPRCNKLSTRFERILANRLEQRYKVIRHFRLSNRQEIDIYLPDLHLGIEVNGIPTHNSSRVIVKGTSRASKPKDPLYHKNKTDLARKEGINLIHIWEHEPFRSEGLSFLSSLLHGKKLDTSNLPGIFKLRVDFYPMPPNIKNYTYYWKEEHLTLDTNGNKVAENNPRALDVYTAGYWIFRKKDK